MKFDLANWEKNKKRTLFFLWPLAISGVVNVLVVPAALDIAPKLALLTLLLTILVIVPFIVVDVRRQRAISARENRELQAKHDAQDQAIFGEPFCEIGLWWCPNQDVLVQNVAGVS